MTEAERIAACEDLLLAACREAGESVTGDRRVGEATAARLLGYEAGTLANWRGAGSGPEWYRIGGIGHRVSYRLRALAEWIEAKRVTQQIGPPNFTEPH